MYECENTVSLSSIIKELPTNSVIIVVGGEVLCARNESMFLHMQSNYIQHLIYKVFRRISSKLFTSYSKNKYGTPWEFPFIVSPKFAQKNIKVAFNTVGGDFNGLIPDELSDVTERINASCFFSVRDTRTFEYAKSVTNNVNLAPDSAYVMSDLISKADLERKVNSKFSSRLCHDFFVFQASPNKKGSSESSCIQSIAAICAETNMKAVLLPIGYASGHDDLFLLKKIHKALPLDTILLEDLSLWEIMYTIMRSKIYFGTSLHGAITAMSFNIPHFGINKKVEKLNAFLHNWSVAPFNHCYSIEEIINCPSLITDKSIENLRVKTNSNISKVKLNFEALFSNITDI